MRGLAVACALLCSCAAAQHHEEREAFKRLADGRYWTTRNLDVEAVPSHCYEDTKRNCHQYGRLYTWESARQGCQSLGNGWRLPTDDEWRRMAKYYGGVREDSVDNGQAAYKALLVEGRSGFDALLGGNISDDGLYAPLKDHGFYWTASESDSDRAWFYNFSRNVVYLSRHSDCEKQLGLSVRCIRE